MKVVQLMDEQKVKMMALRRFPRKFGQGIRPLRVGEVFEVLGDEVAALVNSRKAELLEKPKGLKKGKK